MTAENLDHYQAGKLVKKRKRLFAQFTRLMAARGRDVEKAKEVRDELEGVERTLAESGWIVLDSVAGPSHGSALDQVGREEALKRGGFEDV